jgi:hypothetical protein
LEKRAYVELDDIFLALYDGSAVNCDIFQPCKTKLI